MIKSIYRISKTILLVLLVGSSMVLSYFLWSGNLEKGTEIGFVQGTSLPISTTPVLNDTISPYQITVQRDNEYADVQPNSSEYQTWTSILLSAQASHPKVIGSLPSDVIASATFNFGIEINDGLGNKWMKNLTQALTGWQCRTIVLYAERGEALCHIAYVGENDAGTDSILSASTGLTAEQMMQTVSAEVEKQPATAWNDFQSISLVPEHGSMQRLVYTTQSPDLLPLIHTFFVNPQAITRIAETSHTNLWTDGSRAVQVDSQNSTLDYEDPNASQEGIHTNDYVTAINFLHAHGGGPTDLIGFDSYSALTVDPNAPSIVFTQYVDGYPILNNGANYSMSIDTGRVLQFDRPLWTLGTLARKKTVPILDAKRLGSILKRIAPSTPLDSFHVELGYVPLLPGSRSRYTSPPSSSAAKRSVVQANHVELEPAYYISSTSGNIWVIDAVTGEVLPGGQAT